MTGDEGHAPRVLVTGPVEGLESYAAAARGAGWQALPFPLIAIEPHAFDRADVQGTLELIAITSANALPWLAAARDAVPELLCVRCAVVGARTAERVRAFGFELAGPHARDAEELAVSISARVKSPVRVLWPRGSLSETLGTELRARGHTVLAPLAYTTRRLEPPDVPLCEAILFASPSAVRSFAALRRAPLEGRCVAIAIGASTSRALLGATVLPVSDTITLPEPTPEAFADALARLDLRRQT
jgi:uroporphyrinogen-III synthase